MKFITNLQIMEAKRIAKTKNPSVYDKKKLIQIGWRLFKGDRLPVDKINEDNVQFETIFNQIKEFFK